ncbi:hypothetical protein EDD11_007137 [Mortierella claussenii]|nr:hypothetical protein EDD11_007137 [Mortierella claussenii]
MSLPNECLTLLVHWVASLGIQELFPLLCVNKRFFHLVVPVLYKDPFRLSARWVWKRSVYKGVIERQTKLIRTLLLCCTRTINRVIPIEDADRDNQYRHRRLSNGTNHDKSTSTSITMKNSNRNNHSAFWSDTTSHLGRAITAVRRGGDKEAADTVNTAVHVATGGEGGNSGSSSSSTARVVVGTTAVQHADASVRGGDREGGIVGPSASSSTGRITLDPGSSARVLAHANTRHSINTNSGNNDHSSSGDNVLKSLLQKFSSNASTSIHTNNAMKDQCPTWSKGHLFHRGSIRSSSQQLSRVEQIPIIWDSERDQPEIRRIPGLGRPNVCPPSPCHPCPLSLSDSIALSSSSSPSSSSPSSSPPPMTSTRLKFPPELAKTVIRLSSEPAPMVNYLSYVTHTDVRSWSAASNMTLVHQILGDAKPSWHARLQNLVKKTTRRIMGKHDRSISQSHGTSSAAVASATMAIYDNRNDLDDYEDEDEDGMEMAFNLRHGSIGAGNGLNSTGGRYRRWRRNRTKRNKNLWELRDVDFLELVLLFYTSGRMETLSLGMNCSHWYHPSLNVLLPGIPEQLSGLRRIVINHADTIVHNAVPVPQLFIQRHQKAFPGQLREIQVRQSYHYSYDMSKSVLQTIKTMKRIEVLDLSIWTGVFSGLESICTDHLRKLLICHHMDVPRPDMFDELVKRCPVLEDLSIIVPHPKLFSWAADIRRSFSASSLADLRTLPTAIDSTRTSSRRSLVASRITSLWAHTINAETGGQSSSRIHCSHSDEARPASGATCLPPLKNLTLFGHTPDVVSAFKDVIYAFQDTLESIQVSMYSDMSKPSDAHFEVPQPHFSVAQEHNHHHDHHHQHQQNHLSQLQHTPLATATVSQATFFGIAVVQNPGLNSIHGSATGNMTADTNAAATAAITTVATEAGPSSTAELSSLWGQEILTGIQHSYPAPPSPTPHSARVGTTIPSSSTSFLTWDWPLPRLRTMSLRGPVVAYFDLELLRFCPQLTDLALSYHCSRLPRLVYPGTHPNAAGASTAASSKTATTIGSLAAVTAPSTPPSRFPKIMICDSLAFKWGILLPEDRRSLVIV